MAPWSKASYTEHEYACAVHEPRVAFIFVVTRFLSGCLVAVIIVIK